MTENLTVKEYQAWTLTKWGSVPEDAPLEAHLDNAVLGLCGELQEAIDVYNQMNVEYAAQKKNLLSYLPRIEEQRQKFILELGDVLFYLCVGDAKLNPTRPIDVMCYFSSPFRADEVLEEAKTEACRLCDIVKKTHWHKKPWTPELRGAANEHLVKIRDRLAWVILQTVESPGLDIVMAKNMEKLNRRYVAKMTPAEAEARVDVKS